MEKEIIAYLDNEKIIDTQSINTKNSKDLKALYFDNSKPSLEVLRHSCAHLMAQAIKILYPEAKFFVGPVVEEGFYYDFRVETKIGEEDLIKIEKKMKELVDCGFEVQKYEISKKEALEKFKDDDLKQEVMLRIPDEKISIYKQGEFEDLCRGPHIPNTKFLKFFKLTRIAGAYLGGDEKREMLTRIYGIAFADKESLKKECIHL